MEILGIDVSGPEINGGIVDTQKGELLAYRYRISTPKPAAPSAVSNHAGIIGAVLAALAKD